MIVNYHYLIFFPYCHIFVELISYFVSGESEKDHYKHEFILIIINIYIFSKSIKHFTCQLIYMQIKNNI
jgi:hypothetical protein